MAMTEAVTSADQRSALSKRGNVEATSVMTSCHFGRLLDGFFGSYLAPRLHVMVPIDVSFREVNV